MIGVEIFHCEAELMNYLPRVLGNEATRNRIGAAIEHGRLPHALLIDGAEGSGKMTLALEIAAALNCKRGGNTLPCGECDSCRLIRSGEFVDVKILKRQEIKATIGVGEIKEFRQDMFLSATEADYKVYIIGDSERMTAEAQNALLKVLEEPPARVVIILLANGSDRILTTIKSRAQYIAMERFNREQLRKLLMESHGVSLDREELELILTEADGVLGRALDLIKKDGVKASRLMREEISSFISALGARAGYSRLLSAVSSMPQKRKELSEVLEGIMLALRDMIAIKNTEKVKLLFFTSENAANDAARSLSVKYLLSVYDIINTAHSRLEMNVGVTALLADIASQIKLI